MKEPEAQASSSPIIQPAATIMLLRMHRELGIQSLLLKRNEELKFAPGYWVFPGGKIELEEIEQTKNIYDAALRAATRETKEETGIDVEISDLRHYVHWTTPKGGNRRFGTWFFYAWTDMETVRIDNSEIVDYKWMTPNAAFQALKKKEIRCLPPTYISLLRISTLDSKAAVDKEMAAGTPTIVPQTKFKDGIFYSFYEGDAAFGNLDHELEGSRHRIVGDLKNGIYDFQYDGCEHIFPVCGHSVLKN